jgi:hypothetical protein
VSESPTQRKRALVFVTTLWVLLATLAAIPLILLFEGYIQAESAKQLMTAAASIFLPVLAAVLGYTFNRPQSIVDAERIKEVERRAEEQPDKPRFAWDLARIKLEAYFDRNLSQINLIFWFSVGVMIVGFGFVLLAIMQPGRSTEPRAVNYVGAAAGIITEFIGATFMLLYRSTIGQATSFMSTLDQINTVGMAVQILDSIPESESQLKNNTKAEIVQLLLLRRTDNRRSAKTGTVATTRRRREKTPIA